MLTIAKLALSGAALLFAAVVSGVGGVLWQSRAANLQRIRAEANAQEMRELSNSFLSEIDQAVRSLPGSTSVRQLIVQRILEHLDNVVRNGAGDRLTRLYLLNAYIQLGRLQGGPGEENIGDAAGGLISLNKGLALAQALRAEYPNDRAITEALIRAFKFRSLILYGVGRPKEAVASIRPAIELLDTEIAIPTATAAQFADAGDGYLDLALELGDPDTASMGDYPAALGAYKKADKLYNRSLSINPSLVRAEQGIALCHLTIGHILILTYPAKAITEFHEYLTLWDALPSADKSSVQARLEMQFDKDLLGKALTRTREYRSAIHAYDDARKSMQDGAATDHADSRAQTFLTGVLGDEADTYIDMLNPLLISQSRKERQQNARHARDLLRHSITLTQELVAVDPNNAMWAAFLGYEKVLLGTLEQGQTGNPDGAQLAAAGISALNRLASAEDASSEVLFRTTAAMLTVLPMRLRDPRRTVQYAERLAALSHYSDATSLVLLAQAYRVDGQFEKAKATAEEGLKLLPPRNPGTPAVRCRILLEQAMSGSLQNAG